jgi:murein DD-endopeptidase MepM/ murein hydrolase activator NlpD
MIHDRYYVKIVPQKGDRVHRFHVRKRYFAAVAAVIAAMVAGSLLFAGLQVLRAHAQVASLRTQTERQRSTLDAIDAKTEALRRELQHVQRQNQEIRQLIGAPTVKPATVQKTSWVRTGPPLDVIEEHLRALSVASASTQHDSDGVKTLALRVLNMQHLRDLARASEIAAIPSIDPVDGAAVVGCFCYRSSPDSEFHEGVDLGADYGETVRAAAAGTVVASGYDGGYGIKVDIDHGNGYHTWYAHLSQTDVSVGQRVYKGETIAEVGATGFATGPHLHYQIMYEGQPIDPSPFLHGVPSNVLAALP